MLKHFKELKVWRKSYKLCLKLYQLTATFPKAEVERMLMGLIRSLERKHLNT